MEKIMVRNDSKDIKVVYNNVSNVLSGAGIFVVFMENGETATFHHIDEEDETEWYYYFIH